MPTDLDRCGRYGMWDFQKLFLRHAAELDRFLRRRGHCVDTAADLTQDTFLRTLNRPPSWPEAEGNARAYLFRVSGNLSRNHKRHENVLSFVPLDDMGEVAGQQPSAERVVQGKQDIERTRAALAMLPPVTRRAFLLYRLGDRTIADVAQDIGLSTTRTWALIHQAYRHLMDLSDDI